MSEQQVEQKSFVEKAGAFVAAAYAGFMKGGEIQAFFRQGANELGAATKAFPDSIQVDEPGAVFNPLYSDIAADKREAAMLPTPGGIAGSKSSGSIHGDTLAASKQALPSPSEIANQQHEPYQPGQDHGLDRGTSRTM